MFFQVASAGLYRYRSAPLTAGTARLKVLASMRLICSARATDNDTVRPSLPVII